MCVPGLSGKMSWETDRELERRELRWVWHWSPFYTDAYCMTHSFAAGRVASVGERTSAYPEVCVCVCVCVCVWSNTSLFATTVHHTCKCLTWFVAQSVFQIASRCLFYSARVSLVSLRRVCAPIFLGNWLTHTCSDIFSRSVSGGECPCG